MSKKSPELSLWEHLTDAPEVWGKFLVAFTKESVSMHEFLWLSLWKEATTKRATLLPKEEKSAHFRFLRKGHFMGLVDALRLLAMWVVLKPPAEFYKTLLDLVRPWMPSKEDMQKALEEKQE